MKNLTVEQLKEIASVFASDNWVKWNGTEIWDGHDLVGSNYIFQLSYEGTLRIYTTGVIPIELTQDQEDSIRKVLNKILQDGK